MLTVRQLRRRWKPHKERLREESSDHSTSIRFHRACSWLNVFENMNDSPDHDLALISQWIAFNSLYGQWDKTARVPLPDRECWRRFMDRILNLDADDHVTGVLQEHKPLILSLLDDEYLSNFFWKEPGKERAKKSRRAKYDGQSWYVEGS